jgi:hypothetical protein
MAEGFGKDIKTSSPRVSELKRRISGLTDSESIMMEIMDVFRETEFIPDVGKYYTFIYLPKTQGIDFDQFPLIACTDIQRWGFKGLNFHWGTVRNYTWLEVAGKLHTIKNNEIDYLRSVRYARFMKS